MPDQNSAADEHSLLQDISAPLQTLPDDPVAVSADVDFPIVLRGYDRVAVEAYIRDTSQLVAELQATRSPDAAVRRALERVGEQVSGILQRAHETAAQITTQSRSEAEDRLQVAREESVQITAVAERRVRELDAETDRIWSERQRIVEDARQLAQDLLTLADAAVERFPAAGDTGEEEVLQTPAVVAADPSPEQPDLDRTIAFEPPGEQPDSDGTVAFAPPAADQFAPDRQPTDELAPGARAAEQSASDSRSTAHGPGREGPGGSPHNA